MNARRLRPPSPQAGRRKPGPDPPGRPRVLRPKPAPSEALARAALELWSESSALVVPLAVALELKGCCQAGDSKLGYREARLFTEILL